MSDAEHTWSTLVRHTNQMPVEPGNCGTRQRLIGQEDDGRVAAWAHAVDMHGSREHYHRRSAELYYVLAGQGQISLDGQWHDVALGSIVHIPPGVIHGTRGEMRVLVIGIPDISADDIYYLDE